MYRSSLESTLHSLWSPLLQPNTATPTQTANKQPQEARPSLQRFLALVGEAAHDTPPGRRSPDVGFALEAAHILTTRYDLIAQVRSSDQSPVLSQQAEGSEGHMASGGHENADSAAESAGQSASDDGAAEASTMPNGDWDHIDESELSPRHMKTASSVRHPMNLTDNGVLTEASVLLADSLEVRWGLLSFASLVLLQACLSECLPLQLPKMSSI